jgi:hypothetical protein
MVVVLSDIGVSSSSALLHDAHPSPVVEEQQQQQLKMLALGTRGSAFNCLARHLGYCTTAAPSFGFWHHQPHCSVTPNVEGRYQGARVAGARASNK